MIQFVKSLKTETTANLDALLPAILDRIFKEELHMHDSQRPYGIKDILNPMNL